MEAEGGAGKPKSKRQWKKINADEILNIQSYEEVRKGNEKGKGKNEKGKGKGNGKSMPDEGKGKGKGKHSRMDEGPPSVEGSPKEGDTEQRSYRPAKGGGRRAFERDGKGKGRGRKGFPSAAAGPGFTAVESAAPAPEEARAPQAPSAGPFAGGMNYMPPMAQAMPFDVAQLPMYPPYMGGGMGMPFIGYMPEMMPGMSSQPQRQEVVSKAQRQIDYYFSKENLIKDVYLRRHIMDTQGWVSLTSLAQFPKLAHITSDLGMLVEAVGNIQKLEMKQDASAVRLREDWQGWVLQPGT